MASRRYKFSNVKLVLEDTYLRGGLPVSFTDPNVNVITDPTALVLGNSNCVLGNNITRLLLRGERPTHEIQGEGNESYSVETSIQEAHSEPFMSFLHTLDISAASELIDISGLARCGKTLHTLYLGGGQWTGMDLKALSDCTALRSLSLSDCFLLSELGALSGLDGLQVHDP